VPAKQRHEMVGGRIRARYGHSTPAPMVKTETAVTTRSGSKLKPP
jgi:RNA:NAD 2'-phosphotransferase (TPT1/KptA family)